jgi:hypothetical protein
VASWRIERSLAPFLNNKRPILQVSGLYITRSIFPGRVGRIAQTLPSFLENRRTKFPGISQFQETEFWQKDHFNLAKGL